MTEIPTISGYRNLSFIGEGGMGIVFRAERSSDSRVVAIKMLKKDLPENYKAPLRQRMRRELDVCKTFAHPYLVKVLDGGNLKELGPYFVMEYLTGISLEDGAKKLWLTAKEIKRLTEQMAEAMAYYSSLSVLHRDIKPSNIFLAQGERAVLLDFGLVHRADFRALTATGDRIGTFCSMAPEQVQGLEVDFRSDIYGLGVSLYYAATKEYPRSFDDLVSLVNGTPFPPVKSIIEQRPDFPPELAAIIEKCLAPNPDDRFENATALVKAVERLNHSPSFIDDEPLQKEPKTRPERQPKAKATPPKKRRSPLLMGATLCLLLLLIFFSNKNKNLGDPQRKARLQAQKICLRLVAQGKLLEKEKAAKLGRLLQSGGAQKKLQLGDSNSVPSSAIAHLYLAQLAKTKKHASLANKYYLSLCQQEMLWLLGKEQEAVREGILQCAQETKEYAPLENCLRLFVKAHRLMNELHYGRLFLAQLLYKRGTGGCLVESRNLLQGLVGKDGPLICNGQAAALFIKVLSHFSSKEEKFLAAQDVERLTKKVAPEFVAKIYLYGAENLLQDPVANDERMKALDFLERALRSNPQSKERKAIHAHLAEQFFMCGKLAKSVELFLKLPHHNKIWRYHYVRAKLALGKKDFKGALQAYDEAIKLLQDNDPTKDRLIKHRQRTALKHYAQSKKDIR